jgi:hypothetical protein
MEMSDRHQFIRDAFQDDALEAAARHRLWSTMQHRRDRAARLRYLVRAGGILLVGAVIATVAYLRGAARSSGDHRTFGPVMADSLPDNTPSENSMIQEPSRETVPSNLIPLLGHRSSLRIDIVNAEQRRDELVKRLEQTAGREHDRIEQELASLEQQIEASRLAINAIDHQLMGIQPPAEIHTYAESPPQVFQFGSSGGIPLWMAGGAGGVLLLGMLSILVYMRSIARSTKLALSQIEGQVSSQHATLASGIDAIAVEVERLGEGQRFMSKVLSTPEPRARAEG